MRGKGEMSSLQLTYTWLLPLCSGIISLSCLVSPRFWFCFSRVNDHSLPEFIKQYPSSFRKSWISPLYCVFLGCSKKNRLKTDHPLRFLLEAWCSPGTTFSLHLLSPSIPGKLHVEKRTAEHSSWKDHHVVPYWIVWMHTPGVHMPVILRVMLKELQVGIFPQYFQASHHIEEKSVFIYLQLREKTGYVTVTWHKQGTNWTIEKKKKLERKTSHGSKKG